MIIKEGHHQYLGYYVVVSILPFSFMNHFSISNHGGFRKNEMDCTDDLLHH